MVGRSTRATLGDYFTLQRGTTYKSALLGQPGPVLLGLASLPAWLYGLIFAVLAVGAIGCPPDAYECPV